VLCVVIVTLAWLEAKNGDSTADKLKLEDGDGSSVHTDESKQQLTKMSVGDESSARVQTKLVSEGEGTAGLADSTRELVTEWLTSASVMLSKTRGALWKELHLDGEKKTASSLLVAMKAVALWPCYQHTRVSIQ
jgi:hypothetical protein